MISIWKSLKSVVWERVKFILSSANGLNLDQSCGKGVNVGYGDILFSQ